MPELGHLEPRSLSRPRAPAWPEPREASSAPRATATLAELYLRQGHIEEAAEIYRRMLTDDPGNPVARAALSALVEGSSTSPARTRLELYRSYAARLAALREERDARA